MKKQGKEKTSEEIEEQGNATETTAERARRGQKEPGSAEPWDNGIKIAPPARKELRTIGAEEKGVGVRGTKRTCLQCCVAILEFADNTERQLIRKLRDRGYSEREIIHAISRVKEEGLFSERNYALRFLAACAKKDWGERRILLEMRKRGFGGEYLSMASEILAGRTPAMGGPFSEQDKSDIENLLSSLDFFGDCVILIDKMLAAPGNDRFADYLTTGTLPEDREERSLVFKQRQKVRAALVRRGYSLPLIERAEVALGEHYAEKAAGRGGKITDI